MADSIFRQKLRELRKAEGLSCRELGKILNMSDQTIQKIEVGRIASIEPENIVRLANFFSVSCDELLTGVKPENSKANKDLHLSDAAITEGTWEGMTVIQIEDKIDTLEDIIDTVGLTDYEILSINCGIMALANQIDRMLEEKR